MTSTMESTVITEAALGTQRERDYLQPISLLTLLNVLLRHGKIIGMVALIPALAAAVPTLFGGRSYSATASFVPQLSGMSAISGLAAQFGLSTSSSDPSQSPAFYIELVQSREILGPVAQQSYKRNENSAAPESTFVQLHGGKEVGPAKRRQAAIQYLRNVVKAKSSTTTNVITLTVTDHSPWIADQVLNNVLARLNDFNLRRRQGQATVEKQFAEARLAEVGANLRSAEDKLQLFLETNRVRVAPELTLDEDRLRRNIEMQQQLYNSLLESFETAKLNEVRDNPVINIIDQPEIPVLADGRGFTKRFIVGFLIGFLVGVISVILREYWRLVARTDPIGATELTSNFRSLMRRRTKRDDPRESRA